MHFKGELRRNGWR